MSSSTAVARERHRRHELDGVRRVAGESGALDGAGDAATVSIVQVRELRPGETIFYAEDGRSSLQTGGSPRLRVPDPPFDATLEPGAFGATFLRLPNEGPRVRVSLRD